MIFNAPHASFFGWEPSEDPAKQELLSEVLKSWDGTTYRAGQQCKGGGVDCVRFVCAVLDEVTGSKNEIKKLPPDACFHQPETAQAAAQVIRDLYQPNQSIDTAFESVQPGDVLIAGPKLAGPGHAMIVGCESGVLWHSTHPHVHRVGMSAIFLMGFRIFDCYRPLKWITL